MWSSYSDNMRVSEIALCEKERVPRERVRAEHSPMYEIPKDEEKGYNTLVQNILEQYVEKSVPAMPCYGAYTHKVKR